MSNRERITEATLARLRAKIPPCEPFVDPWAEIRNTQRRARNLEALCYVAGMLFFVSGVALVLIYLGVTR